MPSAIVTGCAGFIGSHLTEELLRRDWDVTGIDNFHPYYARHLKEENMKQIKHQPNFKFIEGSILCVDDLEKLPADVDYVFHFAAIAGVRYSIEHPDEYFEINVGGTSRLLEKYKNVKKFVYASSSSVYGNLKPYDLPVEEDHDLHPIAPYGESKKQAEELCLKFSRDHGTKMSVLRFYTVYGPRQRPDEAVTKFIRLAQTEQPIPIYGDGTKERDFTYILDIVDGSILAALKGNGIYNLGTGKPITVNQMVEAIERALGRKIQREFVESPLGDVEKTHANISKAQRELQYFPKISFEKGIDECVKWCLNTKCVV